MAHSASFPIHAARNRAMALLMLMLQLFQLFWLPLFLLPRHPLSGLIIVPLMFTANIMWSLIHEGIHRLLHPVPTVNDRWSRVIAIAFGGAFDVLKFGHLMHHRYNRDWESEYYDPRTKSHIRAALEYYGKLLGGIYFIGFAVSLLFLLLPAKVLVKLMAIDASRAALPGLKETTERYFFERGRAGIIRHDTLFILLLYGASLLAYGVYWPWFLMLVVARAFTVSFMDNIYHYATPVDNSVAAKEVAMGLMGKLFLNGNLHHSHHRSADVPWQHLPDLARQKGILCTQTFAEAARDQWRGPIAIGPVVSKV